jgi:hypothetical protein
MRNFSFYVILFFHFVPQTFAAKNACNDYAIGESRLFSPTSDTPVHYAIQKDSATSFTVYVNLDLGNDENMRTQINTCLAEFNQVGFGTPDNNIFLKLYDPSETQVPKPKAIHIHVHEHLERANSSNYEESMGCRAIAHEMFHSAGLVDEYAETWIAIESNTYWNGERISEKGALLGLPAAYDCRAKSTSLMGDWGTSVSLKPSHIRQMAWPNCRSKNIIYKRCTANAYQTSKKHLGEGCAKMPDICKEKDAWLE